MSYVMKGTHPLRERGGGDVMFLFPYFMSCVDRMNRAHRRAPLGGMEL